MDRKQELLEYICGDSDEGRLLEPVIEEFVHLEEELTRLRGLPFIRTNPNNPAQQKATPAARLYRELLQQYTNVLKILRRAAGDEDDTADSPLREWARARMEKEGSPC
ncbi:MAG: hypothetical protein HFH58_16500 [Lachnospiraceae bacterium]|jgi:hypothetical protein|nr:hypothetical protein [Lachnospiraceae bacterium]